MKYLIFDMSNMLYRTFYGHNKEDAAVSFAHHISLMTLNKYFKAVQPDKVVMVFDRSNSWRKLYTSEENLDKVTHQAYKGNRRQDQTPKQKEKFFQFMASVKEFEALVRDQTSVICLAAESLEADDLIAGFVQMHPNDEHVIVSGDSDFIQLLRQPGVEIIDPKSDKKQTLDEWDGDADLFMFEKCIRGDKSDNVMACLPRVYKKVVKEAYHDPYKRVALMNTEWVLLGKTYKVKDIFEENAYLMDLSKQPPVIREIIEQTINEELGRKKRYSFVKFLQFCGKHQLRNVADRAEDFAKMLAR